MLRQRLAASAHDLRAEGARVDGQHLVDLEGLGALPAKDPALRQNGSIVDGAVANAVRVDIVIIRHCQVHTASGLTPLQGI